MRNLSRDEITAARAELKPSADELAAAVLQKHTVAMKPRAQVAPDMVGREQDWQTDTRPRINGQPVGPV